MTYSYLNYYLINSFPPMYGLKASGILMLPSACKLFSKNAISIRGGACLSESTGYTVRTGASGGCAADSGKCFGTADQRT